MSWLSDFYRKHPEYRALRVARRSACSIHFEIEPGVYEAHFQIRPIYSRVHRALWMPSSLLADAARLVVAAIRNPYAAAQFAAGLPLATVLTLQPDGTAGIDALCNEPAPDNNYETLQYWATTGLAGGRQREVVKFNIASIPSSAKLTAATLSIWNRVQSSSNIPITFNIILAANAAWTETGVTWNYAVASATRWAGDAGNDGGADAGCSVAGTDFNPTALGSVTYAANTPVDTEHQITFATAQVQTWLTANYGFVVTSSTADGMTWRSSDYSTAANRPKLVVTYTLAAGGAPIQQPFASPFRGPFG